MGMDWTVEEEVKGIAYKGFIMQCKKGESFKDK